MDLNVELPNGVRKTVPVHKKCTLREAVDLIGKRTGLCQQVKEMEEFSLAWKDDNAETFINVTWLNPVIPLVSQGVGGSRIVLLRKKYFLRNEDLDEYSKTNHLLLENIYAQLRQSFVAGLYQCTAFQAAQIGGMAALVEYPAYMVSNPKSLRSIGLIKKILPEKFWHVKGIENQVAKGIEKSTLSEKDAMKAFISRLRKLETFGFAFFTVNLTPEEEERRGYRGLALLGIGPLLVLTLDIESLEPLGQWYFEDLISFEAERDVVHMQFAEEMVTLMAEDSESVIAFLGGCKKQLTKLEAEEGIQRSQSQQQSLNRPEASDSEQKEETAPDTVEQTVSRLKAPMKEEAEAPVPAVAVRPVAKPQEQKEAPSPKPPRLKDVNKVDSPPVKPKPLPKPSKQTGSPPVKPRPVRRSLESEVVLSEDLGSAVIAKRLSLPTDLEMDAPPQSIQKQQNIAPSEDKSLSSPPSEDSPPPVPRRQALARMAPSEDSPPPVPRHQALSRAATEDSPPPAPRHQSLARAATEDSLPPMPRHQALTRMATSEDSPPPVPRHQALTRAATSEDSPPPAPRHQSLARAATEDSPPPMPRHQALTRMSPRNSPPPMPRHHVAAAPVAPSEAGPPPVPLHKATTEETEAPPKPPRRNISSGNPPTVSPQQEVEETLSSTDSTTSQINGGVIQIDASLDIVMEEDEGSKFSHPGSPASLSSHDSSRSEEEKRIENEKKFDTLSRQEVKALQGRKERLKALKKKKEKGDMKLSTEDLSEMQTATEVVKRRVARRGRDVCKRVSLPVQSASDYGSLDELNELMELDLSRQRWSQEINPIYDVVAATEAESLLISSDVTYEDPGKILSHDHSASPFTSSTSASPPTTSINHQPQLTKVAIDAEEVKQAQAAVDSIYSRAIDLFLSDRSGSSASNQSKETENGDCDTGLYGLVGEQEGARDSSGDIYQVPTNDLGDDVEEDIYRFPDRGDSLKKLASDSSSREPSPSPSNRSSVLPHGAEQPTPGIGKRRLVKGGSLLALQGRSAPVAQVKKAAVEPLKDYTTLKREYRVHFVKVPTGDVVNEMVNLNERIGKVITRLCALIGSRQPELYSLYLEGSVLTSVKEPHGLHEIPKAVSGIDPLLIRGSAFAFLPDQGMESILLDRGKNFKDHDIHTSRLLALRLTSSDTPPEPLHPQPLRVPPDIKFHQCWLNIVQGSQPCSQDDAIRLAAMQYQTYFLDRTQQQSTTAHHKVSEFLPFEYTTVRNIEEKVLKEQMTIRQYSRQQAQDSYVHDACTLPAYRVVFFPVKEPRKRFLQNTKLMPMLLGVAKSGVIRVDPKSKEILDSWDYRIIRNWAYTSNTFLLAFDKQSYPVQTNQGKWINSLIEFHVKSIVYKETTPPTVGAFEKETERQSSPAPRMRKKEPDLTIDVPSQDDVNAIYGEVSEGMFGSSDAPLCTPV